MASKMTIELYVNAHITSSCVAEVLTCTQLDAAACQQMPHRNVQPFGRRMSRQPEQWQASNVRCAAHKGRAPGLNEA
jgi:hypothetical protein